MLKELDSDDWWYVFAWSSNEDRDGNGSAPPEPAAPGVVVDCSPFDREDVVELFGIVEGENDGPEWTAYGRLRDGRFFSIAAGCDYTGWGCQSGGRSAVAATREDIERFGITDEERQRYAADAKR